MAENEHLHNHSEIQYAIVEIVWEGQRSPPGCSLSTTVIQLLLESSIHMVEFFSFVRSVGEICDSGKTLVARTL